MVQHSSGRYYYPIICCFIKIQNGFTVVVPAYPGCPEKEAIITGVCLLLFAVEVAAEDGAAGIQAVCSVAT